MSQFPQNIFHSQLLTNKPAFHVRNSDDYFPDNISGHTWHVFINAHNALFNFHLNLLPDWDMFQTKNQYSAFHAAARCVSGGPVYITDYVGQHDLDLISQITAITTRGQTIVLRPSTIGKTIEMYSSHDETRLLKVGSFHGGKGGTSILSLFNMTQQSQTELVNVSYFPGLEKGQDYVVRAHTTGEVSKAFTSALSLPLVSLEIPVQGYEILSAYPLHAFSLNKSTGLESSATKIAVLGLLGKMTGAAAVVDSDFGIQADRLTVTVTLKALGLLGIYVSTGQSLSLEKNLLITIQDSVIPFETVRLRKEESVLEVDVEQAWEKMGLKPGYSDTVGLVVRIM